MDSDDMLSGALILVECIIFLIAFLIVSDVYEVDHYDRDELTNTAFFLVVTALAVFVPLNIVTKIPSLDEKAAHLRKRFWHKIDYLGLHVPSLRGLDARSRQSGAQLSLDKPLKYVPETERHTAVEMKSVPGKDGGT